MSEWQKFKAKNVLLVVFAAKTCHRDRERDKARLDFELRGKLNRNR